MKIDKKEKSIWYRRKFKKVQRILDEEFKNTPKGLGFNRIYWARKKQLLKEMYDIDWQSPRELNPGIIFD